MDPVRNNCTIVVTDGEKATQALLPVHLDAAMRSVREFGYVILENAVDTSHLDRLRTRMTRDSQRLLRLARLFPSLFWSAAGARQGHLQQSVPRSGDLVFRDVVCNPFAHQVTSALLGARAFYSFPTYSCNVNCPGSVDQDLHYDPGPPGALVVNIALRDVSEADGAIEIWPGSHKVRGDVNPIPEDVQAQRRRVIGPTRGETRKGSLMIRDLAMWHRGRANPSTELRHMIAMIHYPETALGHPQYWEKKGARFATSCREVFNDSPIRPNVRFTRLPLFQLWAGPMHELGQKIGGSRAGMLVKRAFKKVLRR